MNNCITKLLLCHFYNTKIRYSHLRKRKKKRKKKHYGNFIENSLKHI